MSGKLDIILERIESREFKLVVNEVTNELWDVIWQTINDKYPRGGNEEWQQFYMPAMRHQILASLEAKCAKSAIGWNEVLCNAIREEKERG